MAKQKKTPITEEPQVSEVIDPVSVTNTDSAKAQGKTLEIPAGHVLIVSLNEDGTEKEHSEFFYPEKSYKRFYGDETKFTVKKKAQ